MVRYLKFRIKEVEESYLTSSENNGADQLCVFVFAYAKSRFSHDIVQISTVIKPENRIPCKKFRREYIVQFSEDGKEKVVHHDKLKPFKGIPVPQWIQREIDLSAN